MDYPCIPFFYITASMCKLGFSPISLPYCPIRGVVEGREVWRVYRRHEFEPHLLLSCALQPTSVVGWAVRFNLGVLNDDSLQIPQLKTSHVW